MSQKSYIVLVIILLVAIALMASLFIRRNAPAQPTPTNSPSISAMPSFFASLSPAPTPVVSDKEISRGDTTKKQIIFTFDSGAGSQSAQEILDTLQKHNVTGTFFTTGKFTEQNPELIKKISTAGHEIFNHTYSHPYLTKLTDDQIKEELKKCDDIVHSLTGKSTKPFFRPPYGDRNAPVLKAAAEAGYQSVFWTTDALDWETDATAGFVRQRIYANLKSGSIILMHVGDVITGEILDEVITYVENQGYKIVSLSEGLK